LNLLILLSFFTFKYLFMKKNLIIFVALATTALISLAFIIGNNYGEKTSARSSYTISKETAHKYVTAWQKHEESLGKKRGEYVEAFDMNATELQDIMKALTTISKNDISKMGVRFYLGINEAGKQTLVIVTIDEKGNNVAHYKDEQGNLQSAIFDFTTPRPPFGGQESDF
jgi:hypothetical protein